MSNDIVVYVECRHCGLRLDRSGPEGTGAEMVRAIDTGHDLLRPECPVTKRRVSGAVR